MKKIIIILLIAVIGFFVFYKPAYSLNIEGDWTAKEVRYNGKEIPIDPFPIKINNWADSIYIFNRKNPMKASFDIKYDHNKPYVVMSSNNQFLNGKFDLTIDTLQPEFNSLAKFKVDIKLESNTTYLHLQQDVYPKPPLKELDFPRRGRP